MRDEISALFQRVSFSTTPVLPTITESTIVGEIAMFSTAIVVKAMQSLRSATMTGQAG